MCWKIFLLLCLLLSRFQIIIFRFSPPIRLLLLLLLISTAIEQQRVIIKICVLLNILIPFFQKKFQNVMMIRFLILTRKLLFLYFFNVTFITWLNYSMMILIFFPFDIIIQSRINRPTTQITTINSPLKHNMTKNWFFKIHFSRSTHTKARSGNINGNRLNWLNLITRSWRSERSEHPVRCSKKIETE